jgi:hypothetical protein
MRSQAIVKIFEKRMPLDDLFGLFIYIFRYHKTKNPSKEV